MVSGGFLSQKFPNRALQLLPMASLQLALENAKDEDLLAFNAGGKSLWWKSTYQPSQQMVSFVAS